jgi:dTDP-4-amino-4,6-dideoxygalactose transaminase
MIPIAKPTVGEEEKELVLHVLGSGQLAQGAMVARLEAEFAAYIGVKHAIATSNGTTALHLACLGAGFGPGDEVITVPFTFIASANSIVYTGARPVFVDIERETYNLDPDLIEAAITPRTRAIMPVHFGGLACDMAAILPLAAQHGLAVVEDAAHATGTRYQGRMVGALGTLTNFSFYANKNLTTAEGGMITTDDPALVESLLVYRLHGLNRDAWQRFAARRLMLSDVIVPGYKFNMPDLAAALGLPQLRKQEPWLVIREAHARYYDAAFADLPVRRQPRPADLDQNRHALHLYVLLLEPGAFRVHRNAIINALLAENIGAALHYRALHTHPYYRDTYGYRPADYPHAYAAGEHILSLPLTPGMAQADLADVVAAVRRVLAYYAA